MKKWIVMAVVAAMFAVLLMPVTAQAAQSGEPSRTQGEYMGGFDEAPGNGDTDRLRTQDRLYDGECDAECDGDQTQTQTQTQAQTKSQSMNGEGEAAGNGASVNAEVKAGAEGETPDETPVAATIHAETQSGGGFFGDMFAGLQRAALRFMSWFGLS